MQQGGDTVRCVDHLLRPPCSRVSRANLKVSAFGRIPCLARYKKSGDQDFSRPPKWICWVVAGLFVFGPCCGCFCRDAGHYRVLFGCDYHLGIVPGEFCWA